jgi:uncharacterized membrane protein
MASALQSDRAKADLRGEDMRRKGVKMDRLPLVVFDRERKAYEGKKALLQLDAEGSISVYGYAVVAKNADGTATIKQGDDVEPLGTLVGTTLGSLIGVLVGPVGLAIGAMAGLPAALQQTCTTLALATISSMMFQGSSCRPKWRCLLRLNKTRRPR